MNLQLRWAAPLLALLPLAASCQNTSPYRGYDNNNYATGDEGLGLRTAPFEGTRYLTSVGLPGSGAIRLPDWVVNPTLDGVLGAIGIASRNQLGTSHQVENARASARLEIARMLEVRIQDVGRRDVEQHLTVGGKGELEDAGSRKSLLGVDRNIADSVLSGSRQRALWFDPSSGDCYVWMVMDGAVKQRADHYIENGVSIYVANQAVNSEFRPEYPAPVEIQAPAEVAPDLSPLEDLESRLLPIETVPVSTGDRQN